MDLERSSNFDETEVSDSLHIDEIAYKEPQRSFYNDVDQSLAEFEELERNLDRTNYDHIFAEVDDAAADIERIRNREQIFSDEGPTDSQEEYEVYDEYAEFGPNYGYSQSEKSSQKSIEEQETSRQEDEYEEMLDQLQSQVNSTETASGMRLRGFYTYLILYLCLVALFKNMFL